VPSDVKPHCVREYEAAKAYVARLEKKRDDEHNKIPLTDAERAAWGRRIAKAERVMYGRLAIVIQQREKK
jgi:hypothetical protein